MQITDLPIERTLEITPEEVKKGCKQSFEFTAKYFDLEGKERFEKKSVDLVIEPKTKSGTLLRIPRVGLPEKGRISSDLIVTVKHSLKHKIDKKHFSFLK